MSFIPQIQVMRTDGTTVWLTQMGNLEIPCRTKEEAEEVAREQKLAWAGGKGALASRAIPYLPEVTGG